MSWQVHQRLVLRDGPHCYWCGDLPARAARTRDHLIPWSAGGSNSIRNQVLACATCNHARRATPADVWGDAVLEALTNPVPGEHPATTAAARLRASGRLVVAGTVPEDVRREREERTRVQQRVVAAKSRVERDAAKRSEPCRRCGVAGPDGWCECVGLLPPWPTPDPGWQPEIF